MDRLQTFNMPDVGEGLTEAEVLTWNVAVGDTITINQIMVEIETAKAAVELPAPYAGRVHALLVEPGVTVDVGTPIIQIDTDPDAGPLPADAGGSVLPADAGGSVLPADAAGAASSAPAEPQQAPAAPTGDGDVAADAGAKIGEQTADGRIATLVGYVSTGTTTTRRARRGATGGTAAPTHAAAAAPPAAAPPRVTASAPAPTVPAPAAPVAIAPAPPDLAGQRAPLATPPVRKLAKDLGVDLRTVVATRQDGVITRADVEAAAAGPVAGQAEGEVAAEPMVTIDRTAREQRIPIKGVRKMTANAMVSSAFTAPHVTEFLTVDVTPMMQLRDRLRKRPEFSGVKITPLTFAARAVCLAAKRTPEINSTWDEAAGEIVVKNYVNLGIAAATPRGLIVPNVPDADQLDLLGLATALAELTEIARSGKTPPSAMTGGTITITNVGVFGVDTGTPIINPGESAILALGSIKDAPWVVDGELAVRKVCQLAVSFDHRVVDGQQGSVFLADIGAMLADPGMAMVF